MESSNLYRVNKEEDLEKAVEMIQEAKRIGISFGD